MSAERTAPQPVESGDDMRGAPLYAIILLVSAGWMLMSVWNAGHVVGPIVILVMIALLLVLKLWLVPALLSFLLVHLFVDEPRYFDNVSLLGGEQLLFALAVLIFVVAASRYLVLTAPILPWDSLLTQSLRSLITRDKSLSEGDVARMGQRSQAAFRREEIGTGLMRVLLAILIAWLVLFRFPLNPNAIDEFGIIPPGLRTATIAWALLFVVLLVNVVLTPLIWKRLSTGEARVYLTSVVTRWCFHELRAVAKRKVKQKTRRPRRGGK